MSQPSIASQAPAPSKADELRARSDAAFLKQQRKQALDDAEREEEISVLAKRLADEMLDDAKKAVKAASKKAELSVPFRGTEHPSKDEIDYQVWLRAAHAVAAEMRKAPWNLTCTVKEDGRRSTLAANKYRYWAVLTLAF
jgi:hypothetical protein